MDYVTALELFIDLKPRICEVCTVIRHHPHNHEDDDIYYEDGSVLGHYTLLKDLVLHL